LPVALAVSITNGRIATRLRVSSNSFLGHGLVKEAREPAWTNIAWAAEQTTNVLRAEHTTQIAPTMHLN